MMACTHAVMLLRLLCALITTASTAGAANGQQTTARAFLIADLAPHGVLTDPRGNGLDEYRRGGSQPRTFTILNGILYLIADTDKGKGRGFFMQSLDDDLHPLDDFDQADYQEVVGFARVNAVNLIFSSNVGVYRHDTEDGSTSKISNASARSFGGRYVEFDGNLYFSSLREVYKTDGETVTLVYDIGTAPYYSEYIFVKHIAPTTRNHLFFVVGTDSGTLHAVNTDGLVEQVALPDAIATDNSGSIEMVVVNDKLVFVSETGLVSVDANLQAEIVIDEFGSFRSIDRHRRVVSINRSLALVIAADGNANLASLVVTDGTVNGTNIIANITCRSGIQRLESMNFARINGTLYFNANFRIYFTDGTTEGTGSIAVNDSSESPFLLGPESLTAIDEILYFTTFTYDKDGPYKLWASDGTAEGTHIQEVVWPDNVVLHIGGGWTNADKGILPYDGGIVFVANTTHIGQEPWALRFDEKRSNSTSSSTAGGFVIYEGFPFDFCQYNYDSGARRRVLQFPGMILALLGFLVSIGIFF